MNYLKTSIENVLVFKLEKGKDLMSSLKEIAVTNQINSAMLYLIGAVKKATFGFYKNQKYQTITINENLEILSCLGNISKKDDEIIIHTHVTFGNSQGKAFGGHLLEGSIIDPTAELFILQLKDELKRKFDPATKLSLLDL
ncbi:MAG: DUF296 domain-containing protein [Candidatus Lokiarchaeota archaeon]|nr:DUF296 domain-containing protein [Candidatus Lokiarchaeota archaeon]